MERVRAEASSEETADGSIARRRRRGPSLLAAALVVLLSLGASYAVLYRHPADAATAGCYQELRRESRVISVVVPARSTPVEVCVDEWPRYFHIPAPASLTTCVLDEGGVGVFPYPASMDAREACSSIGAAIPTEGRKGS
jgi:hypothetical protein